VNSRIFSNLCMVYKILNGLAPPPLRDFVYSRSVSSIRSSRIASIHDCTAPFRRTAFSQSSFSVKATNQWNVMKSCSSISTFKNNKKNQLKAGHRCTHSAKILWLVLLTFNGFYYLLLILCITYFTNSMYFLIWMCSFALCFYPVLFVFVLCFCLYGLSRDYRCKWAEATIW